MSGRGSHRVQKPKRLAKPQGERARLAPEDGNRTAPIVGLSSRASYRLFLLAVLPMITGCSLGEWYQNGFKVGPNYAPPAAEIENSWQDANDPRVHPFSVDNACWWTAFGDATLNCLIAEASEQNLSLKEAGSRILEARAQRGIATGELFPQTQEATGAYSRNAMSANSYPFNLIRLPQYYYDNWTVGTDASWELDFWGRFRRGIEAADANLDAQVAGYDNVLVMLQGDVATNYIQMRAYEERIALAQKNIALQQETLRIVTLREQNGLVTQLDVEQATTNLGTTESLLPTLISAHHRAENRLCVLMGKPPFHLSQMMRMPDRIPLAPPDVVTGIPADLLRRRPDVRQAERQAAAQSAQIGIAAAEFYPHVALVGSIGLQAQNASQLFESSSLTGSIGPGIHWNILAYGRIVSNVNAQEAKFQEALLNYRDAALRANEEVEDDITAFITEQDRLRALQKSAQAAERSVGIALQQYEKGLISYQPLLDSQRALVAQQDAVTESRGLVGVNLVAIYRALGGGWQVRLAGNPPSGAPPAENISPPHS